MTEKHSLWQSVMTGAYSRWEDEGDLHTKDYDEFIAELDELAAKCVVLGNLNYQVENGGFTQWHDNGYSSQRDFLVDVLDEVEGEATEAIKCLVQDAQETLNYYEEIKDEFAHLASSAHGSLYDFSRNGEFDEMIDTKLREELERLDNRFYEFNEQFQDEVEAWVRQQMTADLAVG